MPRNVMVLLLALVWEIAFAQTRVTAAQVAQAVLNSPTASPQLKQYAAAIGNLAIFESGGRLAAYNGSCCFGVLQMNRGNIRTTLNIAPEEFQQLPLQQQVDAWATVMSSALNAAPVKALASLQVFDNRPVDGNLVLACVQLGAGNCMKMIKAGVCSGFADILGTTICKMADEIAGTSGGSSGASTPQPVQAETGWHNASPGTALGSCITDGYGNCLSVSQAMESGFRRGSGVRMDALKSVIQALTVAATLLILATSMVSMWQGYAAGTFTQLELVTGMKKASLVALAIFTVMMAF